MGYGEIVGGGPTGRYTLSLDYGESTRTQTLAALNEQLAKLDVDIAGATVALNAAKDEVATALLEVQNATDAFIGAGGTGNLSSTAAQAALKFLEQQRMAAVQAQKLAIDPRLKLDALKIARAQVLDLIVRWNAAVLTQTKDAWCTDYTENGAGGVETIDIDGESGLTLITPGCRGWTPGRGAMYAPNVLSPAGAFWNLAAAPGWQKWKPTYRWGTISNIDKDTNTATVSLANATSSQQNLPINQSSTLTGVPVVYMTCHASAFEDGDRVVVEFQGQDWGAPRVIGFLDNPKPCLQYKARYYVIGYGVWNNGNLELFDTIERGKDEDWEEYSAPDPGPTSVWKFVRWSDGVTTLARNDGKATEDISVTAEYAFAPRIRMTYSAEIYVDAPYDNGRWTSIDGELYFVYDAWVMVDGGVSWKTIEYGIDTNTPEPKTFSTKIWEGISLYDSAPRIMDNLVDQEYWDALRETLPGPPIFWPNYPTTNAITASIKFPGSENVYTVTATASTVNPYPGAVITRAGGITDGSGILQLIDFAPTSWSATYA